MERPKINNEIKLEAAKIIAEKIDDANPEQIAECYSGFQDGYELARALDRQCGWDLTMMDVEELDCMDSEVRRILLREEKKWFEENDIKQPLPLGSIIKQGRIDHINEYSPARYCVKENGCTNDSRFLIIKFEDAVLVDEKAHV